MKIYLSLFLLLFCQQSIAATCDTYLSRISVWGESFYFSCASTNKETCFNATGKADLAMQGVICSHYYNNFVRSCSIDGGGTASTSSISIYTSQCEEDEVNERDCSEKGTNGGIFFSNSVEPIICSVGCIANNIGSNTPVFGHETPLTPTSTYRYSGQNCPNPNPYPLDDFSETDEDSTNPDDVCTVIDDYQMCRAPDLNPKDGVPDLPMADNAGDKNGCMSVIQISTGNSTTVCEDPNEPQDPDLVCGFQGLDYTCVNKDQCTYKNGQAICIDSAGDYVGTDNADNPLNGGNLDGDNSNDIVSPGTQIDSPLLSTGQVIDNQNQAQAQSDELAPYLVDIANANQVNGQKLDEANLILGSIASGITDLVNKESGSVPTENADLVSTDFVNGSEFESIDFSVYDGDPSLSTGFGNTLDSSVKLDGSLTTAFNSIGGCSDLSMNNGSLEFFKVTCSEMSGIKNILSWVLYILVLIHAFRTVIRTKES